ncbi:MAG: cation:proton antiporter, partial [Ilumatobacteraceae bacterium]
MHSDVALVIAGVLAAGLVAQILGWRLRVPAIVFLLAFGLLAGPVTDLVHPDDVFGDALFPTVSIAVAIILFEGSLAMGVAGIRTAGRTTITLLTVGSVITFAGVAVAARFVLDVEWRVAYLLAAVLVVTGPTVIGPIVKSLGLHGRLGMILEAEGTIIDPIGAIATVVGVAVIAGTPWGA